MNPGFSIIRYSPDPEEIEYINIALYFWGLEPGIVYLDDFPRLSCIYPLASRSLLTTYLKFLEACLNKREPHEARAEVQSHTSQYKCLQYRELYCPLTSDLKAMLVSKYLESSCP
jgi:hypothetical protein